MNLESHEHWLTSFYKQRNWYQYSPFIRINFLTEEVGELSRAVRALEIGRDHPGDSIQTKNAKYTNLTEELADVLDQVLILCSKYQISPTELLNFSEKKLHHRFNSHES